MALQSRYNGAAAAGAFYGYTPLVIKITDAATTGTLTANTGGSGSAITEGGYEKAVRAIQSLGSVVWLSAQASDSKTITAIVDGSTYNNGAGASTSGSFGALKDALTNAGLTVGGSNLGVTSSSVLNSAGTFTFA
jgi:hypothetical protein